MVDAIVSFTVQKLSDFLIQEASFLLGVKDEIASIKNELIWMRSFLKDAEQRQGGDERIRLWVAEIRSIAFQTEDIIDAFYAEVKGKEPSKRNLLTTSLRKLFCVAGEANVYDIGKEIKALKERLDDIARKRGVYGIRSIGNDAQEGGADVGDRMLRDLRRTMSFADEEHFVGLDADVKLLRMQLFSSELRRSVVSIWGMGGLGKTSLARKLYNTNKGRFEFHAWICVSQRWNIRDLLARIIKSFQEPTYDQIIWLEKMSDDDMKRHLSRLLKDKLYLVVIDDIWDEEAWECLRSVLPDNQNGSRVIITTRNESVAELSDSRTYIHKLRRLREDESWELFCKTAFSNQDGDCSEGLEEMGKEMVAKCDGLPLAIIVLGGLLSRKQSNNEWHVIQKRIWKALTDKSIHISALLDLSYDDLPRALQSCFLYLGIFPEDHEIRSEKLVRLWIAEDLIPHHEGLDLEELAEGYIKELSARSLVELRKNVYGPGSSCRVHDLLQDLAATKAKELDFFHVYGESGSPACNRPFSGRRIALRSGFERYMAAIDDSHTQVHTLSFLNYQSSLDAANVTKLITLMHTRFKSLRVLDLEGVKTVSPGSELKLIEAIGKLAHLRYLGLFEYGNDELPECIGNLQALQTLEVLIRDIKRIRLPIDMYKLKHLRHLSGFLETEAGGITVPSTAFEEFADLHSLDHVDIGGWLRNEESDEFALNAFSKLRNLRILSAGAFNIDYRLSIEPLFSYRNLFYLKLTGSIKSLPMELHESLPRLEYVYLFEAEFVEDPLPALEKLPNLLVLGLYGFKLKSLVVTAKGFYKLISLSISDIPSDMDLQIDEGALPSLRRIDIYPSTNFTLPERFDEMKFQLNTF